MKSFANSTTDEATDIHHIYNDKQLYERGGTGHNKKQLSQVVGATSNKCRRKNYFAKMCHPKTRPLYGIQTEEDGQTSSDMFISTMQKNRNTREWQITLPMNNHRITFKNDSDDQCNVITKQKYLQTPKTPQKRSTTKLRAFGGHRLITCGKATILCQYNSKKYNIEFVLLGLGAILIQDDHPIAYVSRSLTSTQRNYAQIEKCLLW